MYNVLALGLVCPSYELDWVNVHVFCMSQKVAQIRILHVHIVQISRLNLHVADCSLCLHVISNLRTHPLKENNED